MLLFTLISKNDGVKFVKHYIMDHVFQDFSQTITCVNELFVVQDYNDIQAISAVQRRFNSLQGYVVVEDQSIAHLNIHAC